MRHLLAASMVALLSLAPAACARDQAGSPPMSPGSPEAARAPYDIQFLDTMAQHHRDGIKMSQMAVAKAQSEEVRRKAQRMVDDQRKEIPELESMRDGVMPDAPEAINTDMPGMMPMDMGKLERSSGSDFDRPFVDMTIEHHRGAIAMARSELRSGRSPRVEDKAREIIDKQGEEMAELERLRRSMK